MIPVLTLLLLPAALAWTGLRGEAGQPLRLTADNPWTDQPYLPLAGNPANAWGVEEAALRAAVVGALYRWRLASGEAFAFDYWQGDDPWFFPRRQRRDGFSAVFFASGADQPLPDGVSDVARTEVWYEPDGEIVEVDILLNDLLYDFSGRVLDLGPGVLERPPVDLDDVLTHELGHALGLDHATTVDSTMSPWTWPGQTRLGCDDLVGIREVYGTTGTETAALVGSVEVDGGEGPGAQVVAISVDDAVVRGAVLAEDGRYELAGLQAGEYVLLAEPFLAGRDALGFGYGETDIGRCADGSAVARSFLLDETGGPAVLELSEGEAVEAPLLRLACGAAVAEEGVEGHPGLAFDDAGRLARLLDPGDGPAVHSLGLAGVGESLRVDLLAPGLYAPVRLSPRLLDGDGQEVPAEVDSPRATQDSGFVSWDARLEAWGLEPGDYLLELEVTTMPGGELPGGEVLLEAEPFVLLLARTGEDGCLQPPAEDLWQGSCWLDEPVLDYESPEGAPLRREVPGGCAGQAPAGSAVRSLGLVGLLGLRRRRAGQSP